MEVRARRYRATSMVSLVDFLTLSEDNDTIEITVLAALSNLHRTLTS